MEPISIKRKVGITPDLLFSIAVKDLINVTIHAVGAIEMGAIGVSVGDGVPLSAGNKAVFTWQDFPKDVKTQNSMINIYGVAAIATNCRVFGWRN